MELTHLFISNAGACALWRWALVAPSSWLVSWCTGVLNGSSLACWVWRFTWTADVVPHASGGPYFLEPVECQWSVPLVKVAIAMAPCFMASSLAQFSLAPLWQVGLDLGSKGLPAFNASCSAQTWSGLKAKMLWVEYKQQSICWQDQVWLPWPLAWACITPLANYRLPYTKRNWPTVEVHLLFTSSGNLWHPSMPATEPCWQTSGLQRLALYNWRNVLVLPCISYNQMGP